MDNFFLYGGNQTPDIIMGKYSPQGLNPEIAQTYRGTEALQRLSEIKVNKYELWFSNTINFIPYDGSPVFTVDTAGNLTHSGNLFTKKSADITENVQVGKDVLVGNSVKVANVLDVTGDVVFKKNLNVELDVKLAKDLYVTGKIFNGSIASAESINEIKKELAAIKIDEIKKELTVLKEELAKLKERQPPMVTLQEEQ